MTIKIIMKGIFMGALFRKDIGGYTDYFCAVLKGNQDYSEIKAKSVTDYKPHSDIFGSMGCGLWSFFDEINNKHYNEQEFFSKGYRNVGQNTFEGGLINRYKYLINFYQIFPVQFEIYKDGEKVSTYSGYQQLINNNIYEVIEKPMDLLCDLGFLCYEYESHYYCKDLSDSLQQYGFLKESTVNTYLTNVALGNFAEALMKHNKYSYKRTVLDSKYNIVQIDIKQLSSSEGSNNLTWIPNPIMQISGQSSQEKSLNKWIGTLNTTITNSNRTQAEKEKLKWNQDKIDTIWEVCTQFNKDYDVQIDPRLLLAIVFKEGTGSFNTSSSNPAGDGQHGIEFNFQKDVENAVDVLGGKIIAYPYFKDDFSKARADAYAQGLDGIKEKDDLIHYLNWVTPRLQLITNDFSCGEYAGNTTWHRGIRQIYSELAYDDAPADYTNYVISIGKAKITEVANKHGITVKKVTFKAKQNGQDSNGNATTEYSIVGTVI